MQKQEKNCWRIFMFHASHAIFTCWINQYRHNRRDELCSNQAVLMSTKYVILHYRETHCKYSTHAEIKSSLFHCDLSKLHFRLIYSVVTDCQRAASMKLHPYFAHQPLWGCPIRQMNWMNPKPIEETSLRAIMWCSSLHVWEINEWVMIVFLCRAQNCCIIAE